MRIYLMQAKRKGSSEIVQASFISYGHANRAANKAANTIFRAAGHIVISEDAPPQERDAAIHKYFSHDAYARVEPLVINDPMLIIKAAQNVIETWEHGDLAKAVRELAEVIKY